MVDKRLCTSEDEDEEFLLDGEEEGEGFIVFDSYTSRRSRLKRHAIFCFFFLFAVIILHTEANYSNWRHIRQGWVWLYWHVLSGLWQDQSAGGIYSRIDIPLMGNKNCIFDVGANDGVWTSNSYYPIQSLKYKGFLYEMDVDQCQNLFSLYDNTDFDVDIFCMGLSDHTGVESYRKFPLDLENTFQDTKHNQYDKDFVKRIAPVFDRQFFCKQVQDSGCDFTILSIDVEGYQKVILNRLGDCIHWNVVIAEQKLTGALADHCKMEFHAEYNNIYTCDWSDT